MSLCSRIYSTLPLPSALFSLFFFFFFLVNCLYVSDRFEGRVPLGPLWRFSHEVEPLLPSTACSTGHIFTSCCLLKQWDIEGKSAFFPQPACTTRPDSNSAQLFDCSAVEITGHPCLTWRGSNSLLDQSPFPLINAELDCRKVCLIVRSVSVSYTSPF